jgi:hypothetical protein
MQDGRDHDDERDDATSRDRQREFDARPKSKWSRTHEKRCKRAAKKPPARHSRFNEPTRRTRIFAKLAPIDSKSTLAANALFFTTCLSGLSTSFKLVAAAWTFEPT